MKTQAYLRLFLNTAVTVIFFSGCSKSDSGGNVNPPTNPCTGRTIDITATPTAASSCSNNGSISVSATGSAGFTFKVGSGAYQAAGNFNNLAAGTYNVFAKDADGCEKSVSVTITSAAATEGPLYLEVKNLIASQCQSCHGSGRQEGGVRFDGQCNIFINKDRIKSRAVDLGTMPPSGPLSQSDKDKISNWINAGGTIGN
jgi:cytochrome c5